MKRRRNDSKWRATCLVRRGAWCRACGTSRDLQCDHMVPKAHLGPSVVENGLILCRRCHQLKTDHRLLIQRGWLGEDQVSWLRDTGNAVWSPEGVVSGQRCRLFADAVSQ